MRASGEKDFIGFPKGLITEASPLAFPEGFTAGENNFLLDLKGVIRRRRLGFLDAGVDFDVLISPLGTAEIVELYYWSKPDLVLVIYKESAPSGKVVIRFHRNDASYTFIDQYVLHSETTDIDLSESTNILSITYRDVNQKPTLLTYNESIPDISIYDVNIFVRDFELVEDDLQISGRPATLSEEHEYNLLNAGWYAQRYLESTGELGDPIDEFASNSATRVLSASYVATNVIEDIQDLSMASLQNGDSITVAGTVSNDGTYTVDYTEIYSSSPQLVRIYVQEVSIVAEPAVETTFTIPAEYPSNADIAQLGLKADSDGNEEFSAKTLQETVVGNTEAPRGHYVYNINSFDRNTRLASPQVDGTEDTTIELKATVAL